MGDRACVVIYGRNSNTGDINRYSPTVYVHWHGDAMPAFLKELKEYMASRRNDPDYAAARLVGIIHEKAAGNTGLGIFNSDIEKLKLSEKTGKYSEFSHGDAGFFLVDSCDFSWTCYDGYHQKVGA